MRNSCWSSKLFHDIFRGEKFKKVSSRDVFEEITGVFQEVLQESVFIEKASIIAEGKKANQLSKVRYKKTPISV